MICVFYINDVEAYISNSGVYLKYYALLYKHIKLDDNPLFLKIHLKLFCAQLI